MSEPFVGEIRMFAGNFAPRGWAFADGQLLSVSQNDALFSLYVTIYGGDGRTTFGLPDMRGRIPLHMGSGPGLSHRRLGSKGGAEKVTVTQNQMPYHTHYEKALTSVGTSADPTSHLLASTNPGEPIYYNQPGPANIVAMRSSAITSTGGTNSHTNLMPYLCLNFIIALIGIYPSRQ